MRRFDWAGPAPVLDPLPRWVRAEVLSTGDLVVSGRTIAGEGNHARGVQRLLLSGADAEALTAAGVGWVVIENGSTAAPLVTLTTVYSDADLTLYRVGGMASGAPEWKRNTVIAAHAIWAGMLVIAAAILAGAAYRRRAQP
jgi:hypothetical protein